MSFLLFAGFSHHHHHHIEETEVGSHTPDRFDFNRMEPLVIVS